MEEPLLRVQDVGKFFPPRERNAQPFWIIRGLTFTVAEGEFVTMIGPSGAGKSTLLNLIAQVDTPSEGEIAFRGRTISSPRSTVLRPGFDRQIGYVTQEDNLLPWRTTLDNVLFPLELRGGADAQGRARAGELMAAVGLAGFERHYPHELSGGMRKRCALIRTLLYDPPIILMDEPFGALDAQTRAQLQEDLLRLWSMRRKTIIFVTHDIAEAIVLGDRTLILSRPPTRIAGAHSIALPRPRDVHAAARQEGFAALHDAIREQVR
ncbi:ABC transporter ATP-binding protein [Vineibacter terrae]|uniref:ABC transporter ATP-binding protein n=1 Tax=Vineibacter terrae TaxID=2586908 RepID=A0A5C8PTF4_9HYPH|nr:ABC transporter ATP-binding protein [Vineibacter terrae]TXL81556.1 ABC transporter ATP-binding protein [Vineibacter terrae]